MNRINTGLYQFSLQSSLPSVITATRIIYGDAPQGLTPFDFKIDIRFESFVRRFIKPQVSFFSDQHSPFKPLPVSQAPALLEWGMNWCIAAHEFSKLLIHSAVLVKNGKAIMFPALPGSGKSTLTAYLGLSGWSTFSDEMAIIDCDSLTVEPLFRPVCLKNNAIDLVKGWFPEAVFTPTNKDTQKGDVAHLKVMTWQQYTKHVPAPLVAVVFPKYRPNTELTIYQLDNAQAFNELSGNAFNYNVLGRQGFNTVKRIIDTTRHFEIQYNNLQDVDDFLTEDIIGAAQ